MTKVNFPGLSSNDEPVITCLGRKEASTLTHYELPTMPFVEAKHQGGRQKPTAIILRPSNTRSFDGAALAVAQRWHQAASFWSAGHYTVDDRTVYQCVRPTVVAGAGQDIDPSAVRIAMCAEPVGTHSFWDVDTHRHVLRKTAQLVADLTLAYGIPATYLDDSGYERWQSRRTRRRGGIHIDGGYDFPYQGFLDEVLAQRVLKTHI